MYQVTVRGPDGSELEYTLGVDEGLIVGRDESCDIVLPSKRVSRRHARFFTEGDVLFCEDLDSQNGVFVGGGRVQGTQEIRPGPPIEIGEFRIRIKKPDLRAQAEDAASEPVVAHLKGLGQMAGRKLGLPAERGFVGRDPTMDVSIVDDSVSRKHAEIRVEAGAAYMLRDLGSSNGTFVNGTQLKQGLETRLRPNDKIRFGETHWQLVAGAAAGAQGSGTSKKLGLVAALLLVLVTGALALKLLGGEAPPPDESGEEAAQLSDAIGRGQVALDEERFKDARDAFQQALRIDPIHAEARQYLRQAEAELENSTHYQNGIGKLAVGADAQAFALFTNISPSSRSFARARLKVQEIAPAMMKKDSAACQNAGTQKRWSEALETCSRYLDLRCHTGQDPKAEAVLRSAEKALKTTKAWRCPEELAHWFGEGRPQVDIDKALEGAYPAQELRAVAVSYARGDLGSAQRAAARLKGGPTHAAAAAAMLESIMTVDGRFKEGQSALNRGSLRDAEASFRIALEADGRLMAGARVSSSLGTQMRSALARQYLDIGRDQFERNRWKEAFDAWAKGLGYSSNDSALLDGLARLEKVSERLLTAGGDCDELRVAAYITRPGTATHERAAKAIASQCE